MINMHLNIQAQLRAPELFCSKTYIVKKKLWVYPNPGMSPWAIIDCEAELFKECHWLENYSQWTLEMNCMMSMSTSLQEKGESDVCAYSSRGPQADSL